MWSCQKMCPELANDVWLSRINVTQNKWGRGRLQTTIFNIAIAAVIAVKYYSKSQVRWMRTHLVATRGSNAGPQWIIHWTHLDKIMQQIKFGITRDSFLGGNWYIRGKCLPMRFGNVWLPGGNQSIVSIRALGADPFVACKSLVGYCMLTCIYKATRNQLQSGGHFNLVCA